MHSNASGLRWKRLGVSLGTGARYILTFAPVYQVLGHQSGILLSLPVILAAWFYGLPIGLSVSVLLWLVTMVLLHIVGVGDWTVVVREGTDPGLTLILAALGIAGYTCFVVFFYLQHCNNRTTFLLVGWKTTLRLKKNFCRTQKLPNPLAMPIWEQQNEHSMTGIVWL